MPAETPATTQPAAESDVVVIFNGTIVDGTGTEPIVGGVVIVEAGRIAAVGGPEVDIDVPENALRIDAGGGTILPGLIDTHTHILESLSPEGGELEAFRAEAFLRSWFRVGFTTIRDVGSAFGKGKDVAFLRQQLADLGSSIPTVILTGPALTAPGSFCLQVLGDACLTVADPAAGASAVESLADAGVDQIKVVLDEVTPGGDASPSLSQEQVDAIVAAAHVRGLWVVAHVSDANEARMALQAGADELAHWPGPEPLTDDLVLDLVERNVPVGGTFRFYPAAAGAVRGFIDAGGVVLLSSETPAGGAISGIIVDLRAMVSAGMTPMEVIVGSTGAAAAALELDHELGTLEAGKAADILIVAGDAAADVEALAAVQVVLKDGMIVFDAR